jgi:MazG family protein
MTSEFSKENPQPTKNFYDLVKIMHILRNECPWDKKQTHESIRDLMIEEIYEAIDAIDQNDFDELKKELGDILLHVLFHSEMADEKQKFSIDDVIFGIQDKLIRRHPHVFGDVDAKDSDTVTRNWESIKQKEKGRKSVLQGVPETLPGLLKAQRMQEKAGAVGFDWKMWPEAWKKLDEELNEFKEALETDDKSEQEKEFGDLIFSLVNVGRLAGLDAENALRLTNSKFKRRFTYIEEQLAVRGKVPSNASLEEMDDLWNESKKLAEFR